MSLKSDAMVLCAPMRGGVQHPRSVADMDVSLTRHTACPLQTHAALATGVWCEGPSQVRGPGCALGSRHT